MAKRATIPTKKPALRVVSKQSPKSAAEPKDGTNGPATADRETFHYHLGLIQRQADKVVAERKFLKDARRKANDAGINLGDLDYAILMQDQEPETVQESLKRRFLYAYWMGLAPGVQTDLFEVADAKIDAEKAAEEEGYVAGLEGKTAEGDRYDVTNPIGQARLRGWRRGQDVILARFSENATEKNEADAAAKADEPAEEMEGAEA